MSERAPLPPARDFGRVALLMGGTSAEREISLKSGKAVLAALEAAGVDAVAVDVGADIVRVLRDGGFDRALNMLHGGAGEDGRMPALLNWLGIPGTGSGPLGSALAMDKLRSKWLWRGRGLPVPAEYRLQSEADCARAVERLGLPLMVKPVLEGSSIGISKVERPEQIHQAWRQARPYGPVMAEQWIDGGEYTCGVLDGEALPLIRLQTGRAFYDYEAKYVGQQTQYHCPCGLAPAEEQRLQTLALEAFDALGAAGWGRVDFMLDREQQPRLIEVNTVPGMTDHSLVPMAAGAAGIDFAELVLRILMTAMPTAGGDDNAA